MAGDGDEGWSGRFLGLSLIRWNPAGAHGRPSAGLCADLFSMNEVHDSQPIEPISWLSMLNRWQRSGQDDVGDFPASELLEATSRSLNDALALSDAHGAVLAVNAAYSELYGFAEPHGVVGRSFAVIFPEEERSAAETAYHKVFQSVASRFSRRRFDALTGRIGASSPASPSSSAARVAWPWLSVDPRHHCPSDGRRSSPSSGCATGERTRLDRPRAGLARQLTDRMRGCAPGTSRLAWWTMSARRSRAAR